MHPKQTDERKNRSGDSQSNRPHAPAVPQHRPRPSIDVQECSYLDTRRGAVRKVFVDLSLPFNAEFEIRGSQIRIEGPAGIDIRGVTQPPENMVFVMGDDGHGQGPVVGNRMLLGDDGEHGGGPVVPLSPKPHPAPMLDVQQQLESLSDDFDAVIVRIKWSSGGGNL